MSVRRIAITPSVFAVTLSIAMVLVGLIILLDRHQNREVAFAAAKGLMQQSTEIIRRRIAAHIDPIEMTLARAGFWHEAGVAPTQAGHPLRARFIQILEELPQISSLFVGLETGDYFLVGPTRHRPAERLAEMGAPSNAAYIEEIILRSSVDGVLLIDRFLDERGRLLTETRATEEDFDPRLRPWYSAALGSEKPARTDVYTFVGSGNRGLSLSQRIDGGVVGVDITLLELDSFLREARQARDGILAIFGSDRDVIAKSWDGDGHRGDTDLDTLARHGAQNNAGGQDDVGFVDAGGRKWIVHASPVRLGGSSAETLLVAMAVSDIIAPLERISANTLIASILLVAASIPVIWLVSRRISKPILGLSEDAERIRHFDLEREGEVDSVIEEVHRLQLSMSRMRENLKIFARYVPKALVAGFLERGLGADLGGTRREITVLFMDLENFTAMSAGIEPEEVMARMSDYFEAVTRVLLKHGATVDKYIGDAVMAFWNAPDEVPDHAIHACQAALEIVGVAARVTAGWTSGDTRPLRTRIGIHTGNAIVGNVGSSDRMNYTALGATVNLAARLEPLNRERETNILVSSDVVNAANERFVFRSAGDAALKGFKEPVPVFELCGLASSSSNAETAGHQD